VDDEGLLVVFWTDDEGDGWGSQVRHVGRCGWISGVDDGLLDRVARVDCGSDEEVEGGRAFIDGGEERTTY
jgi:hypothetical protein